MSAWHPLGAQNKMGADDNRYMYVLGNIFTSKPLRNSYTILFSGSRNTIPGNDKVKSVCMTSRPTSCFPDGC